MVDADLPVYDALPRIDAIGLPVSWGVLPEDLGALSLLSADSVRAAAHAVVSGETISLSLPLDEFDPPLFGRSALMNRVTETARNTFEDDLSDVNPQASSQWDGFPHIRAREFGFYGGIVDLEDARERIGIHRWRNGITGRGVLVDALYWFEQWGRSWDPLAGDTIEPDDLRVMLSAAKVRPARGDILLVRTGWLAAHRRRGSSDNAGDRFSGIASRDEMVGLLWDSGIAAVGSDNPAVESAPGDPVHGSLHRKLLAGLGVPFAELLDLELLAERCRDRGGWTFLFVAAPTAIRGAVSSPANAIAIL